MKKLLLPLLLLSMSAGAFAQGRPGGRAAGGAAASADTTGRRPGAAAPRAQPKPYNTVITDKALTRNGLFKVHKVDDKYYFEIPDSILNREILVVARVAKAGAVVRSSDGYAGDQIGSTVIKFEKGPANRIFLRSCLKTKE
jgi:hypothetical protein